MLIYIIKSAACLAIFIAFYKMLLEQESIHVFKRFYLLTAVLLAFVIPLITFIEYIDVSSVSTLNNSRGSLNYPTEHSSNFTETNLLALLIWSVYSIGVLLFAIKFLANLIHITYKIRRNPKEKFNKTTRVLLKDLVTPHTFFNYLFLNQQKYHEQQIPQEVLWHEETHAIQKHSLDVIFIEIFQIIFWFNPLIYIIKRSIKLNHEFLADQSVLNKGANASKYQHLLLAFSSNAAEISLANAINYSLTRPSLGAIKKRFTVMKTKTSKQKIIFRSFFLLPLLAILLYGFSSKEKVVKASFYATTSQDTIQDILVYVDQANNISLQGNPISIQDLKTEIDKINPQLTKPQKQNFVKADIHYVDDKSLALTKTITTILLQSGVSSVGAVNINNLKKLGLPIKTPVSKYSGKTLSEANYIYAEETIDLSPLKTDSINSPWEVEFEVSDVTYEETDEDPVLVTDEMLKEYNAIAKSINSKPARSKTAKLKDYNQLEYIYSHMSDAQKKVSEPFPTLPKFPNSSNAQKKATPAEVKEYNKLAKYYNSQSTKKTTLLTKDIKRLNELYNKMNTEQRAQAEPMPQIVPPPPPPPPPSINQDSNNTPPPPPPAPPIVYIQIMKNKGAQFYYNKKSITGDQALEYVKNNGNLKIHTEQLDSETPKVYISTK